MVIKTNLEKIMAEIENHWNTAPRYSMGRKKGFPKYNNDPNNLFPTYRTLVHPTLVETCIHIGEKLETSGYHADGPGNKAVPYIMFRPTKTNDLGVIRKTSKTKKINIDCGAYIGYLFPADGTCVHLVLMYATSEISDNSKKSLLSISKQYAQNIRSSQSKSLARNLNYKPIELKSASDLDAGWESAVVASIKYERNITQSEEDLLEDLSNMLELYQEVAKLRIPRSLHYLTTDENLKSLDLEERKIKEMFQNLAMSPRNEIIVEVNNPNSKFADFKAKDWISLGEQSDALEIRRVGDKATIGFLPVPSQMSEEEILEKILCYKHIILEGPPGVGKTHFSEKLIEEGGFVHHTMLTFHPSTEYTDFIGGLKPVISTQSIVQPAVSGTGFEAIPTDVLELKAVKGHFLDSLMKTSEGKVLIWIDELNRGNVAKIFGELIGLIGTESPQPLSIRNAGLPDDKLNVDDINLENLHIVGTINTADRSISHLDAAIRRRFKFIRMRPNFSLPQISAEVNAADGGCLSKINDMLRKKIGSDGELGHSYLFELKKHPASRRLIWRYSILPNLADLLIREDAKDLIPKINKAIPSDIGFELKQYEGGYSAHIEVVQTLVSANYGGE